MYAQRDEAEVVVGRRKTRGGQMVATRVKVAALAPDSLAFGHGPAIIGGAAAQLEALAETI